jgi:mRNA-degrading endonuclease toxin of MazEF toxin-antitoxin module
MPTPRLLSACLWRRGQCEADYPSHVHLPKGVGGLKMESVAKAEQTRAIQVSRLVVYQGRMDRDALPRTEEAVRITLALK